MKQWIVRQSLIGLVLAASALPIAAQSAESLPSASLPTETSDVAVLPPGGPHRVFLMGSPISGGASVVDADTPELKVIGTVPVRFGDLAVDQNASHVFVAETFWSHGNRGTRDDVLAVYDGLSLNLTREIHLPGRLLIVPKAHVFDISPDGRLGYVYDMVPGSRVHVVDLEKGTVLSSVDLPGCALALPYGPRAFATLCGDGTVGAVNLQDTGPAEVKFSKPFFDANQDPLFESSVVDKATGQGWLMSFSGRIFPVKLSNTVEVGKPWDLTVAAGMPPAGTGVQELAWRPGGNTQPMALHALSKRLFVLMHTGNYWTHKADGTEVWVLDAERHSLLRRITLEDPARSISVSQDAQPLLYVSSTEAGFAVIDANTGEKLRKRKLPAGMAMVPSQ